MGRVGGAVDTAWGPKKGHCSEVIGRVGIHVMCPKDHRGDCTCDIRYHPRVRTVEPYDIIMIIPKFWMVLPNSMGL